MKNKSKIIFIGTLAVQLIVVIVLLSKNILIKKSAEKNNRIYSFDCTYYDPYNILKGRYVQLYLTAATAQKEQLDSESLKTTDLLENEMVYVLISPNEEGLWNITGIRRKKPKSGDFIKAKYLYSIAERCFFDLLISEYYMQENYAAIADRKLTSSTFDKVKLDIYSNGKGEILQKQLYVSVNNNFMPIEEYIKNNLN